MRSQRLKTTMLDFIILNPSSALARMYFKHLIIPAALDIEMHAGRKFVRKMKVSLLGIYICAFAKKWFSNM